jgi:hypothetical protein
LEFLRNRAPSRAEVLAVLSVVVFAVYSWSLRQFFFKLPSLLYYSTPAEYLSILAYMLALALLESLIVVAGLVFVSVILPPRWFKEGFAYKGFLAVVIGALSSIHFQKGLPTHFPSMDVLFRQLGTTGLIVVGSIWLAHRSRELQGLLLRLVDSISIMTYIYVPLGMLALLVVIFRNLF